MFDQKAHCRAKVVRPDNYGQHSLPERQMHKADGKQPAAQENAVKLWFLIFILSILYILYYLWY